MVFFLLPMRVFKRLCELLERGGGCEGEEEGLSGVLLCRPKRVELVWRPLEGRVGCGGVGVGDKIQ